MPTKGFEKSIFECFFDEVIEKPNITFPEYIQLFFSMGEKTENDFFSKPEWEEIQNWSKNNLFTYDKIADELFKQLVGYSNLLVEQCSSHKLNTDIRQCIFKYLDAYYSLVVNLYNNGTLREDTAFQAYFIEKIMTGYFNTEKKQYDTFFRFYSPLILEKICIFYDFYKNHSFNNMQIDFECNEVSNKLITQIYSDMCKEKLMRMFFINTVINEEKYITSPNNIYIPFFSKRSSFSSIEMIRPIRWIDKIRAYIERIPINNFNKNKAITISVMGYVKIESNNTSSELQELFDALKSIYDDEYRFNFIIYVNKEDFYYKNINDTITYKYLNFNVHINKSNYAEVFSPNEEKGIHNIIERSDIIMILDCPNLYSYNYRLVRTSCSSFLNNSIVNYEKEYKNLNKNHILLPQNLNSAPIHSLVSKMNIIGLKGSGYEETFQYVINEKLIKAIRKYTESYTGKSDEKDCHILISSKNSIDFSNLAEINFNREERYNAKTFRLITFKRNNDMQHLKPFNSENSSDANKKNYIVFSLWNLIKNIDIHLCSSNVLNGIIPTGDNLYYSLMSLYIKMTWGDGLKDFSFELFSDDSAIWDSSKITELSFFVEKLFRIILSDDDNLISSCIRCAFYNTIYSQIQCLDDVVFYCLFKTRKWSHVKPAIKTSVGKYSAIDYKPVLSVNQPERWVALNAINSLSSRIFLFDQYNKIEKDFINNSLCDINQFLNDIHLICKQYNYTDNMLYHNISEILENM